MGSDAFKTKLGAFVTLLTYTLMLFNFTNLMRAFFDGSRQDEKQSTVAIDPFLADELNLQENQFEISIITTNPIPENLGRMVAYQLEGANSTLLNLEPCGEAKRNDVLSYWGQRGLDFGDDFPNESILCLNDPSAQIKGL